MHIGDPPSKDRFLLYGSALSPFSLKARALCRHAGLPHDWVPGHGSRRAALVAQARFLGLRAGLSKVTYPPRSELDELPLVPYLFGPGGVAVVDSSAIGRWLDGPLTRLLPERPAVRWACQLIDEAIDEVGLYVLHHHRWVTSGPDTWAPERLGFEYEAVLGRLAWPLAKRFSARQVRRLPYLFSVAEEGFRIAGVEPARTPPSRPGFPSTHALLDELLTRWLDALEPLLAARPYLLGERFTLADASLYGMVASMVALDPSTRTRIESRAPSVVRWIGAVDDGTAAEGEVELDGSIDLLLDTLVESFLPLMIQNEAAWEEAVGRGTTVFNEVAFDRGEALYDGELVGHPFRSVVKTFQVKVYRDLKVAWRSLSSADRRSLLDRSERLEAIQRDQPRRA